MQLATNATGENRAMNPSGGCRFTGMDRKYSIEDLAAFHGHLGPYIVLGYRIGRYVRKHLCSDPFQMRAVVYCSGVHPQSCLADGIQLGCGCTLGKRNIEISACDEIRCEFFKGERRMVVTPNPVKPPRQEGQDLGALIEKLAEEMYSMPDSQLFVASTDSW
ncbi:MAG TPA: formylmethanofuran dehydrogenase subunit E family protein [Methanotrichaceae archaeon]|nr:formylmethanofuran dehydrogenase subunit E family protein [Methanotrichaceae archaeon]